MSTLTPDAAPGMFPASELHGCRTEHGGRRHLTLTGEWTFCGYVPDHPTEQGELCHFCDLRARELVDKLRAKGASV